MDWNNKTWKIEDVIYQPKRKVHNRGSRFHPHVIGEFYSHKMDHSVEYQSMTEFKFFSFLELDNSILRYYVRPVEITDEINKAKFFVPDVLVFKQGNIPCLYDVESSSIDTDVRHYQVCERYAFLNNWDYVVVYPRNLPKVIDQNITFLVGFTKKRFGLTENIEELLSRVRFFGEISIKELAASFRHKKHPLQIMPFIYHLIAIGVFNVDLRSPITENSLVFVDKKQAQNLFLDGWERVNIAIQ